MRLRYLLRPKSQDWMFLLLVGYWLMALINMARFPGADDPTAVLPFYDKMHNKMFANLPTCFIQGPVFVLYISGMVSWFAGQNMAVRCGTANRLVLRQTGASAVACAVFVAVSHLLVLIACIIFGQLHTVEPLKLMARFVLQWLAFLSLAQVSCCVLVLTGSTIVANFASFFFFALHYSLGMMNISVTVPMLDWITAEDITPAYAAQVLAAVLLNVGLYLIRWAVADHKEWYPILK